MSATLNGGVGWDFPVAEGSGLELDSSAHDVFITRTRLVGRYRVGNNVSGFAISLAVSF